MEQIRGTPQFQSLSPGNYPVMQAQASGPHGQQPQELYAHTLNVDVDAASKAILKQHIEKTGRSQWSHGSGSHLALAPVPGGVCMASGNRLECVSSDGKPVWDYDARAALSSPAAAADGTTYVCSADGQLHAIDPKGGLIWKKKLPVDAENAPAVAPDGTIYVVGKEGHLHAIHPDSHELWDKRIKPLVDLDPSPDLYTDPVVTPDSGVIVANKKKYLTAFDSRGSRKWKYRLPGEITMNPTVDDRGNVALGAYFSTLIVLNSNGRERWRRDLGSRIASTPAFGPDGSVYAGDDFGRVNAFRPNGEPRWSFRTDGHKVMARPEVAPDGTVYACAWMGSVFAIPPDGGAPLWKTGVSGFLVSNPRLSSDGNLYVMGAGGSLVALHEHKQKELSKEDINTIAEEAQAEPSHPEITEVDGWVVIDNIRLPIEKKGN